jgi:hypothetical protein
MPVTCRQRRTAPQRVATRAPPPHCTARATSGRAPLPVRCISPVSPAPPSPARLTPWHGGPAKITCTSPGSGSWLPPRSPASSAVSSRCAAGRCTRGPTGSHSHCCPPSSCTAAASLSSRLHDSSSKSGGRSLRGAPWSCHSSSQPRRSMLYQPVLARRLTLVTRSVPYNHSTTRPPATAPCVAEHQGLQPRVLAQDQLPQLPAALLARPVP